jgi:predicted CoA-binding protein
MNHDSYTDAYLKSVLDRTKSIGMVGASPNWNRPSYFVMKYLQGKGFKVYPVNPRAAGDEILGEKVYESLKELPETVDLVDIFRSSKDAGPVVDDAIAHGAKFVWMQLTVRNDEAAERAEQAGLEVVMNRCPKIEYARLYGELSWGGFNSGIISSKKRKLA